MPVNTEHQAYADMKKRWETIDDVCDGSAKVKTWRTLFTKTQCIV